MKFLAKLCIVALSLGFAAYVVPGIHVDGWLTLAIAALLMGIVNAVIKPVLIILTLPITIVTFGLFLFFINAASFALVAWLLPGFSVDGMFAAFLGWLIVTLLSGVANKIFL